MDIRADDLSSPEIIALLVEHRRRMFLHSPPQDVHALDLDGLRRPDITLWSAWRDAQLAGCGALRELDPAHGEIKSMRTADAFLRQGVGAAILVHIMGEARRRGYRRLSLETGKQDAFAPARALYARHGFHPCGRFGDYPEGDTSSYFMTLEIGASRGT
jgi:putative acetyltransferase